ncbi:citrate lyase subunit beta-like protein [Paragonimus westermani]|uniref:Citrate lyase subunit beta-like protein n=1 Tax=Paragonimus westermani TaxID=34504 RepID=A0A5J4N710_9TREM|nr:citrate lyase subunit beta-like protein [Paragonimus westermani]
MIESCSAVINLPKICQTVTARSLPIPLLGVVFGSDDYCVSLGVDRSTENTELSFARQYVPVVAKAFGLSSIDMVDIDFKDTEKLRSNCQYGAQLGFHGKQTIHPAQLPIVNGSFSPSEARIEWSRALLAEAEQHSIGHAVGAGAFNFRGRMIDRPTLKQAEHTVRLANLMNMQVSPKVHGKDVG